MPNQSSRLAAKQLDEARQHAQSNDVEIAMERREKPRWQTAEEHLPSCSSIAFHAPNRNRHGTKIQRENRHKQRHHHDCEERGGANENISDNSKTKTKTKDGQNHRGLQPRSRNYDVCHSYPRANRPSTADGPQTRPQRIRPQLQKRYGIVSAASLRR